MSCYAAQVNDWGQAPTYQVATPPAAPSAQETQVTVKAAALHHLTRSRASGKHYSAPTLPHTVGIDGTGLDASGKSVYFISLQSGTFISQLNVPSHSVFPLPPGLDTVTTAGIVNPAFSSWMALTHRLKNLPSNFTILIVGATTASGMLACSFAKQLGASRVIGAARSADKLNAVPSIDDRVILQEDVKSTDWSGIGNVDVILDYIYGAVAQHLLETFTPKKSVQYVHIGSLAGREMNLNGAVLRGKDLSITGSGLGSWSVKQLLSEMPTLLQALSKADKLPDVETRPMSEVGKAWTEEMSSARLVLTL